MTKISTLENVLSKKQSGQNGLRRHSVIPESETMTMIIRYSMALQVVKIKSSGIFYLIMN